MKPDVLRLDFVEALSCTVLRTTTMHDTVTSRAPPPRPPGLPLPVPPPLPALAARNLFPDALGHPRLPLEIDPRPPSPLGLSASTSGVAAVATGLVREVCPASVASLPPAFLSLAL